MACIEVAIACPPQPISCRARAILEHVLVHGARFCSILLQSVLEAILLRSALSEPHISCRGHAILEPNLVHGARFCSILLQSVLGTILVRSALSEPALVHGVDQRRPTPAARRHHIARAPGTNSITDIAV